MKVTSKQRRLTFAKTLCVGRVAATAMPNVIHEFIPTTPSAPILLCKSQSLPIHLKDGELTRTIHPCINTLNLQRSTLLFESPIPDKLV